MEITYYGHSCFTVEYNGFAIAIDPYDNVPGYKPLFIKANAVYCSHEHGDHCFVDAVQIEKTDMANPFSIVSLSIPHDDMGGAKRGMNTMRMFSAGGKRVVHMGDVGCMPKDEQIEMIQDCDVLMIPVGGYYTIDFEKAKEIVSKVHPKLAIAMHFRKDGFGYDVIADIKDMEIKAPFYVMDFGEIIVG